jgi:hypothetical protein
MTLSTRHTIDAGALGMLTGSGNDEANAEGRINIPANPGMADCWKGGI